jgi:hypothetical protein
MRRLETLVMVVSYFLLFCFFLSSLSPFAFLVIFSLASSDDRFLRCGLLGRPALEERPGDVDAYNRATARLFMTRVVRLAAEPMNKRLSMAYEKNLSIFSFGFWV